MISISVDTSQITDAIRRVGKFISALQHRQDLNQMLKEEQNERWARNFESQGGEYEDWQDTSMSYQQQRTREGFAPTPTLFRSGRTFLHFIVQNEAAGVSNNAVNWNFSNRIAGRNGAYTVSHHTGYTLGGSTVPARLLWDLDEEDEDRGAADVEMWVDANAEKYL